MRKLAALLAAIPALAAGFSPGKNSIEIRGKQQDVWFTPATAPVRGRVVFIPGDGGWRGAAIEMARAISRDGFDVFGWDVKKYLKGFTSDQATLSEAEIRTDVLSLCDRVGGGVVLAGWSQGAAMGVLAASGSPSRVVRGVLAVGLPASGVMGWRWKDDLTYITRQEPDEPKFETATYAPLLRSVPFCLIEAEKDEYTAATVAARLFAAVRAPKRRYLIAGSQHNFNGHEEEFYRRLQEGLEWLVAVQ